VVAFAVLLTVSERFFCPALELISDYLKLPPVVAGATLLSFGNGAPDTFTQVAAIAQVGCGTMLGLAGSGECLPRAGLCL
jgi:Ca2+/Na+ antiporter